MCLNITMSILWKSHIALTRNQRLYESSLRSISVVLRSFASAKRVLNRRSLWAKPRCIDSCVGLSLPWTDLRPVCDSSSFSGFCFDVRKGISFLNSGEQLNRTCCSQVPVDSQEDIGAIQAQKCLHYLEINVQRGNSVTKDHVENILNYIKNSENRDYLTSGSDPGVLLLQCCGDLMPDQLPTARVQLAHHIVNTLKEIGLTLNVHHYNALLRCYIENNHATPSLEFLEGMTASPDEETYCLLLWCACETGDLEQATGILARMKERGLPISEQVFNALAYGHARTGEFSSARGVFETMRSAQLLPSSDTYTALLRGAAVMGDFSQMQKTFQEAVVNNISLSESQVFSVVKAMSVSGHTKDLPSVLSWLPELDAEGTVAMKHLLIHLAYLGMDDAITVLVTRLPVDDSSPFGRFLVREMAKAGRPVKTILSLCDLLTERNPLALTQAVEASLRSAEVELAVELMRAMKRAGSPVRSHFFWPLLLSLGRSRGEEGVFAVLRQMQELEVPVDSTTLSLYVLPHVSLGAPEALVRRLQDFGLPRSQVLGAVLGALIHDGQLNASLALCGEQRVHLECEPLVRALVRVLVSGANVNTVVEHIKVFVDASQNTGDWAGRFLLELLTSKKVMADPRQLGVIIKCLSDAGLRCSSYAADVVSQQLSAHSVQTKETDEMLQVLTTMTDSVLQMRPVEAFSQQMVHPRDMTLEELECQLVELQAKGMNTRGILRRLLQLYCRLGSLEKALEMKQALEKESFEFTPGMRAALFNLFLQRGQLDQAESCFSELTQNSPNFTLDEHKIIDYATLLLANKQDKMAVSALLDRAKSDAVRGGNAVSRNCWRLLNTTAERGEPEVTKQMLNLLVEHGYCTVSNIMLGPVIRSYFFLGDVEGAVTEFQSCIDNHKMTPLHHELLCRLMTASDKNTACADVSPGRASQLLHEVFAAVEKVHGAPSSLVSFVIAMAETGKTKQLTRLLRESSSKLRANLLIQRCRRLVEQNKLESLQNLIGAFRGIESFNLAPLFTLALQIHCRRGDGHGALNLWTSMQEMDCEPSSEFLVVLADLLESHKIEVPFSIPRPGVDAAVAQKQTEGRLDRTL